MGLRPETGQLLGCYSRTRPEVIGSCVKLSGSGNHVENNGKKPLVSKRLVVIKQEWGKEPQDPYH